jgi:hypothetical protein
MESGADADHSRNLRLFDSAGLMQIPVFLVQSTDDSDEGVRA